MPDRLKDKVCPYDNSPTELSTHDDGVGVGFKLQCIKCGTNKIAARDINGTTPTDEDLLQQLDDSWK